jgi:hypothetical protein
VPRVRRAGRAGVRPADDPFQGQRLGQDGSPGDERASAPGRRRRARVGVAGILAGRRVRDASRIAENERRRRRAVLGQYRDAGEVDPTRRRPMKPR